jgi:SAM-dependent methyltransferase
MEDLSLLIDLHQRASRQGPGSEQCSRQAMQMATLSPSSSLKIADIGCGTGATTLLLARELNAQVTAVDFLPEFLTVLETRAESAGLSERITTLACSMDKLPFAEGEYDVIWAEGSIYNMGFSKGVSEWNRFLKPGGLLVVSEITWLGSDRPVEIEQYWREAYPEIATASSKIAVLENCGYCPLGYFVLPQYCWNDNYYKPLQEMFPAFLERNGGSASAQALVAAEEQEIAHYQRFKAYYSYGMYLARK